MTHILTPAFAWVWCPQAQSLPGSACPHDKCPVLRWSRRSLGRWSGGPNAFVFKPFIFLHGYSPIWFPRSTEGAASDSWASPEFYQDSTCSFWFPSSTMPLPFYRLSWILYSVNKLLHVYSFLSFPNTFFSDVVFPSALFFLGNPCFLYFCHVISVLFQEKTEINVKFNFCHAGR